MVSISISTKRKGPKATQGEVFKYIHNGIIRIWKQSIGEFVRAAAREIAVDTGMSMASLEPLAANVRLASALAASAAGMGAAPRKGAFDISGKWQPGVWRSRASGRREGNKAYEIDFGTRQNLAFRFKFKIVVWQYKVHELGMFNNDPWNSLGKGREAFLQHFNAEYPKIVSPELYSILSRIYL